MGKVHTIEPKSRHFVYYVAEFPVKDFYDIGYMRNSYHDGNESFYKLKCSVENQGVLRPIFAMAIGGDVRPCTGKQRVIAALDLGISHVPVIVHDYDNSFKSHPLFDTSVQIETSEEGQAYFDDNYQFTIGRFVSLVKILPWEKEVDQANYKTDKDESQEEATPRQDRGWKVSAWSLRKPSRETEGE